MILKKASAKAVRVAVTNFHYSRTIPQPGLAFSVFEKNEFCGVICFNRGVKGIEKPFNLAPGKVIELARVALNGKQSSTSKALSIALRLAKKSAPACDIVVSYADSDVGHIGTIYQATNWIFIGSKKTVDKWIDPKTNKKIHNRNVDKRGFNIQFGKKVRCYKPSELHRIPSGDKYKYAYPLTKRGMKILIGLKKPYIKKAHEAKGDEAPASSGEKGGAGPTRALNLNQ